MKLKPENFLALGIETDAIKASLTGDARKVGTDVYQYHYYYGEKLHVFTKNDVPVSPNLIRSDLGLGETECVSCALRIACMHSVQKIQEAMRGLESKTRRVLEVQYWSKYDQCWKNF